MNSMSRGYYDPCKKEKKVEKECPTIIKCGNPSSTALPVVGIGLPTQELALASLTLDTSCLCDAKIKIDFTTNLVIPIAALLLGPISIQIFKQCRNEFTRVPIGSAVTVGPLLVVGSQTVSFFTCDSDSCDNDCCTYTAVAMIPALAVALVGGSFNNSTLAATATCGSNKCERCNDCKR